MSSTCSEPEGSSSGRRLCIQYGMVYCFTCISTKLLILMHVKHTIPYFIHNRLPEDEPSGSKHVEDKKL